MFLLLAGGTAVGAMTAVIGWQIEPFQADVPVIVSAELLESEPAVSPDVWTLSATPTATITIDPTNTAIPFTPTETPTEPAATATECWPPGQCKPDRPTRTR
jgi:hypothetical protein